MDDPSQALDRRGRFKAFPGEAARSVPFLAAALSRADEGRLRLYREVERLNGERDLAVSELLTPSARLRRGKLDRDRYDSALAWSPENLGGFCESAMNGAPTPCLREFLANRRDELAAWMDGAVNTITYAGVDFDQRRYKLYLFRDPGSTLTSDADLKSFARTLHQSAYIDCLELDMDTAARMRSAYCKLGDESFVDVLSPTYRPHREIENRILRVEGRARIVSALDAIQSRQRRNRPIIKFRRRAGSSTSPDATELASSVYAIECSLFDADRLKYVNDYSREILEISLVLSCRDEVARWLDAIRPFDCHIHYIGVGDDFVTFYYHSGVLRNKKPMRVARG